MPRNRSPYVRNCRRPAGWCWASGIIRAGKFGWMAGVKICTARTMGCEPCRWRQGIMSEALGGLLAYGFDTLGLNRLDALVMPGNRASIRMLAKLGFQNEGLHNAFERWGDKGLVDLYRFAILKTEWEGDSNA